LKNTVTKSGTRLLTQRLCEYGRVSKNYVLTKDSRALNVAINSQ
jgi:hypothetical protein